MYFLIIEEGTYMITKVIELNTNLYKTS